MQYKVLILSALAGLSAALTPADTSKDPSGNPITAPLVQLVPAGKPFTITWTPSTPGKVSLVLLKGPSDNVVPIATIADSIDNSGTYSWTPGTDLDPTTAPGGYGIQLIVEGTGQYQYSTQFGISKADGTVSITSSASQSYASVETAPPSGTTQGTAEGGALAPVSTVGEQPLSTTPSPISISQTSAAPSAAAPVATGVSGSGSSGSGGAVSESVTPTGPVTVPSTLTSVAQATGSSSAAVAGSASTSARASGASSVSSGLAVGNTAHLSGVGAAVAGLLGFLLL